MNKEAIQQRAVEELALLSDYYTRSKRIDLRFVRIHAEALLQHIHTLQSISEDNDFDIVVL